MKPLATLLLLAFSIAGLGAECWPIERDWDAAEEFGYSSWVSGFGHRSWKSADQMLHDRNSNTLYAPSDDAIRFRADCGDFPFLLRSYYAYKRRLPMILNRVDGGNYSVTPNRTVSTIDNLRYEGGVVAFFRELPDRVETGTLRTDPYDHDTAVYPVKIRPKFVRPGTVFYDPNGHAAVVCGIEPDGTVRFLDAHPDQSVTRIVLGEKLSPQTHSHRGGFLAFRPIRSHRGRVFYEHRYERLPGFSSEQYDFGDDYHLMVKLRMASQLLNPVRDLEKHIREDTYQEALDRGAAVDRGWAVGELSAIPLPPNIYSCIGPWEDLATPGRDIRLRLSMLSIPNKMAGYLRLAQTEPDALVATMRDPGDLARELVAVQERLFAELSITYRNSRGQPVRLSLDDIEKRLFRLSFDPNHPPELRWGATGRELATALSGEARYRAGYEAQQRWRNRLERQTGEMHPTDDGNPINLPEHDITAMMKRQIEQGTTPRRKLRIPFRIRRTQERD